MGGDEAPAADFQVIEGGRSDLANESGSAISGASAEEAQRLVERARALLTSVHNEDSEEIVDLNQAIETALEAGDAQALKESTESLRELLFFVEGRP